MEEIVHPWGVFDNAPADNRHIEAVPLAAAMGAEIRGVDIGRITDAQFDEVRAALFRHKMIFFRDQSIGHADQSAFSRRFGPFAEDAYTQGVPGFPEVQPLIREADDTSGMLFGSGWHTDSPFLPEPPAISMLYGVDIPPYGGDTIWANTVLAWRSLSPTMQSILAPLRVHMSMTKVLRASQDHGVAGQDSAIGRLADTRGLEVLPEPVARKVEGAFHPLVRTHPVSGEKSLFCDHGYTVGIEGMTHDEAAPILKFLVEHITQPAFTCRLRWAPGTFAIWDNRICIHQAFNDYAGYRRELYRTTIAGEAPI